MNSTLVEAARSDIPDAIAVPIVIKAVEHFASRGNVELYWRARVQCRRDQCLSNC